MGMGYRLTALGLVTPKGVYPLGGRLGCSLKSFDFRLEPNVPYLDAFLPLNTRPNRSTRMVCDRCSASVRNVTPPSLRNHTARVSCALTCTRAPLTATTVAERMLSAKTTVGFDILISPLV